MRIKTACLILIGSLGALRADTIVESAQRSLKEQGFYYGEITGEKDADTTAAIRRYQIRHGLQITGELNDETLRSLRSDVAASPQPSATRAPAQEEDTSRLREEDSSRQDAQPYSAPLQPFAVPPEDRRSDESARGGVAPLAGGVFTGTPYEHAPPEVQRNVIVSAQTELARRGLYRKEIDGVFGPDLEFSVRAYQARVGLRVSGRFDLETLAALELLPGVNAPVFAPRRRVWREPPVRGEWIRP